MPTALMPTLDKRTTLYLAPGRLFSRFRVTLTGQYSTPFHFHHFHCASFIKRVQLGVKRRQRGGHGSLQRS